MRETIRATTLSEALAAKREHPDALPIAGGTDLMVELNFRKRRPAQLLDLNPVAELRGFSVADGILRLGAGVTHTQIVHELAELAPALAQAARTVGSPQIRNRGTVGGNLATASPAGDLLPPLIACEATVELATASGRRRLPVAEFCTGPKRSVLAPDELIVSLDVPLAAGPQEFAKVGTRNAMVIAVCSLCLSLDLERRLVAAAIGSAAPTVRRAPEAEEFAAAELDWDGASPLDRRVATRFGELVAASASPIDDVRGTAAYRRHALSVLAARTLAWTWSSRCA